MTATDDAQRFGKLVDEMPVGVFVTDETGAYVHVNDAACEILGYTPDELRSLSIGELAVADDAEPELTAFEELKAHGSVRTEAQLRHRDGHSVDVVLDATALDDGRYIAYCQDVSERMEFERRLAESEARYRSMTHALDTSSVGTFVLDEEFRVVWLSEAVERFFGVSRADLVGADKAEKIHSDIKQIFADPERFAETVTASYEDNTYVESFTCHVLPGDGREERWLLHWSSPIEDGEYAGGRIEHYTDITESVEYERRLEEQRDNLSLLNQVMRHDIRNDLQQVLAHADMLADVVDEAHRDHVEMILENAEEAVELTKTAGEAAELMLRRTADTVPVAVQQTLRGELDDLRATHQQAVVTDETDLDGVTVQATEMLSSVFRNLLKNAVQHNRGATPSVTVTSTTGPNAVVIRVADDGPGIPDDRKDEVFAKGERGLESAGTGIGLYLVRTLVEQYGGSVWVEDNDPTGAVFAVELPRAD